MKNSAKFTCNIGTTDPTVAVGLEIWFDQDCLFNTEHLDKIINLSQEFLDSDEQHEFRFVMKNKTAEMTQLNEQGNIISDVYLTVSDAKFDDIDLGHVFYEQADYTHDYNGTGELTTQKCFGRMGCNGTVTFKFKTPIYEWLLEHM